MKKTAFLSDLLFAFSLIALITLCLFRYLGIRLFPALLLSAICGVLAAVSTGALLQRKNRRFLLRKSEETQKQKLLTHLSLLSDEQKNAVLFERVLQGTECKTLFLAQNPDGTGFLFPEITVLVRIRRRNCRALTAKSRKRKDADFALHVH